MSYTIEKEKQCVAIPLSTTEPDPFFNGRMLTAFCWSTCCNNLTPHQPKWSVIDARVVNDWDGRIMLPGSIWDLARCADGGDIKPKGRSCSGTAYLNQWRTAYHKRVHYDVGTYRPLRIFIYPVREYVRPWAFQPMTLSEVFALPETSKHWYPISSIASKLFTAFHMLHWSRYEPDKSTAAVNTKDRLVAALFLLSESKSLPFTIHIA